MERASVSRETSRIGRCAPLALAAAALVGWLGIGCGPGTKNVPKRPVTLTVSAAISLEGPLQAIASDYEKHEPAVKVVCNFGSSGTLQHQIEQGAPVDIFVSAAEVQMDKLEKEGLIDPATRRNLLQNTLVLIVPEKSTGVNGFSDLTGADVKTIAMGQPETVPAGMYAQQVLEHLGMADAVKQKLVFAKDVRAVLAYVETGNADAGMVYASDARISKSVRVVATAPGNSHDPILYPAAILENSKSPASALAFLHALESSDSLGIFEKAGFEAPESSKAAS